MPINPLAYTEKVIRSFLRYQLTTYPFTDDRLNAQMRSLLSLDETRDTPLLKGPYVSLSGVVESGATITARAPEVAIGQKRLAGLVFRAQ